MAFSGWSTSSASNTLANTGVSADEGVAPSLINDAMREMMAQLKAAVPIGTVTDSTKPAFLALLSANLTNVTGDGTDYTIVWNTELFDQASNFASNTFTAPVTGKYRLSVSINVFSLGVAHNQHALRIVTSNRSYVIANNYTAGASPLTQAALTLTVLAEMDVGDTATATLQISGGTKTAGIVGSGGNATFCGELVC